MSPLTGVLEMVAMGLSTSTVAPAVVLLTRRRWTTLWTHLTGPAPIVAVLFVAAHSAMTIWMGIGPEPSRGVIGQALHAAAHGVLFAGAVIFWLPVLGPRPRLSPAGRCVYLYLTAPALDLSAVVVVAGGHSAAGLAMIVAMLPVGLLAVCLTWQWITEEQRAAEALEARQL